MAARGDIRIGWPFRKLWEHPLLDGLLGSLDFQERPVNAGWGYRPSGLAARRKAAAGQGGLLLMEDAFLRSIKPGAGRVYGVVADSRGIYYDASGDSDLIEALNTGAPAGWMQEGPGDAVEVRRLMERFVEVRASKYNWYPGDYNGAALPDELGVLVVDQTKGDASLSHGGVAGEDFDRMVRDALDEHPGEPVYVRAHPDHRYRGKHSCFSPWVFDEPRVRLLPPDLSPAACFGFCREIYVATSLMGMEGLMRGCTVKAYGWNFYAGWGLTEDRGKPGIAPRKRTLELPRLFEAAYLQYGHYFDPDSGEACGLERILGHLEFQRDVWQQDAGARITVGWTPWQRSLAEDFLKGPSSQVSHAATPEEAATLAQVAPRAKLLLWGAKLDPPAGDTPWMRVEDGFLRSSGLGAAFHRPLSWVFDDLGIYFDPRRPSRLERIFETAGFSDREIEGADELIRFLREHRLTKYNVGGATRVSWDRKLAHGRKVILVPGQVDADASIACGSPDVRNNAELLQRVRSLEPDAYLIFKAHPDLVAAARHGSVLPEGCVDACDLAVTDGNVLDWLDLCDEVHTMTSTVGFEALIRQVPVVTYGLPFYAGWGLTRDHLEIPRRTRRLTLEELVCGALMRYPRYLNPESGEFTSALKVAGILKSGSPGIEHRAWHLRMLSKLKKLWVQCAR